jgi:23S rRNA pseudouridine955/2504/2580 synthase
MPDGGGAGQARVEQVVVDSGNEGQRIDNFLLTLLKGVPRSHVYRVLRTGEVRVNRGRIRQDYRLRRGDVVRIPPVRLGQSRPTPRPASRELDAIRDAILYEDRSLLALAKPSGLAVHGGSGLSYGVIEALRALRPDAPSLELVHRLDRETSGCLLVAKRRPALRRLHELLREGQVEKTYLALVGGQWRAAVVVEAPLHKNALRSGERLVRVAADGKVARTTFSPLAVGSFATLVRATPHTGRTHQIRVHAAHAGHPIAGDPKYGDAELNRGAKAVGLRRLFLHAWRIRFAHPDTGVDVVVTAPLEADLAGVLRSLGLAVP